MPYTKMGIFINIQDKHIDCANWRYNFLQINRNKKVCRNENNLCQHFSIRQKSFFKSKYIVWGTFQNITQYFQGSG